MVMTKPFSVCSRQSAICSSLRQTRRHLVKLGFMFTNNLFATTFEEGETTDNHYGQSPRHTPTHSVGQEHGPNNQGHANGCRIQDAQGPAIGPLWPALR